MIQIFILFIAVNIGISNSISPPFHDYCKMLEKDINGIQHGFLAGNKMYYVGGQTGAYWEGVSEYETLGLTHPFFRDMRSRGFGIVEMADGGEQAIAELNEKDFEGRPLVVNESRSKD